MASTGEFKCAACGGKFTARIADRKRGWARCCSKSCAATINNKKTRNYQRFINRQRTKDGGVQLSGDDLSWE